MLCNKCGSDNPEGSVFCGTCGARVDGKKECPSCGKPIDEKNVFCNFCGARTDGKTVCPNCGTVYEDKFCPQCGAPTVKAHAQKAPKTRGGGEVRVKNALDIVKTSLIFAATVFLFIFSFFVGASISARVGTSSGTASTSTSFYYLITQFKEAGEIINQTADAGSIYAEFYAGLYIPTVFTAVAVGVNMLACITCVIVSIIKFVNRFKNKQPVNMLKYFLVPAVTTLAAYAAVMSLVGIGVNGAANIKFRLNATSITNVALVSVLLAGAAVLQLVIDGKKTLQRGRLMKYITLSLTAVFTLVALATAGKSVMSISASSEAVAGYSQGKVGPMTFFMLIMMELGTTEKPPEKLQTVANFSTATAIVYLGFFLLLCVLLYFVLRELTSERCFPISMILAASAFVISIGYLVVSVLLNNQVLGTIGASPIVGLIMCAFTLAGTLTWLIQWLMLKKEN